MTVYVDDMLMAATIPGARPARWSHLVADTPEELHEFAARLGLRRSWFQEPKGLGGLPLKPESLRAQHWHYDVTATKRAQAIRMGAVPVTVTELVGIIRERHARLFPEAAADMKAKLDALAASRDALKELL